MTDYWPKPGDEVLLTVRATADGNRYEIANDDGLTSIWITEGHSAVVRIEPAPVELPTGFGARIRATVGGIKGVRLVRVSASWRVHPEDFLAHSGLLSVDVEDDELFDVEILNAGEPS